MDIAWMETPLGYARLEGNDEGLAAVSVHDELPVESYKTPNSLKKAVLQLEEYFKGERREFELHLNPSGTDFQRKVWRALLDVPFGKTLSYLELSKQLGDVKAIRAVAAANGKNPLWIIIPCHRIIGSDGSLTGYAGGLHRKKWLLNHESPNPQQQLF